MATADTLTTCDQSSSLPPRGWKHRLGLVAVAIIFAAGLLQFATLQWWHAPAEERVNDGAQPTFFAFHVSPQFNFSEDFHLYYLRAKRILDRGWSDSLLHTRGDAGSNYVAPVQVALSTVALATDGRPVGYSLYMFVLSGAAWSALVLAARAWLPPRISSGTILLAVLVTVLFEALPYLFRAPEFPTFGQWPAFRGLRLSTMAWTSPLLIVSLLASLSLVFERERWLRTVLLQAGVLLILAGADNWAFAMAWVAAGIVTTAAGAAWTFDRWRSGAWPVNSRRTFWGLALMLMAVYAVHQQFSTSLAGDGMLRSGIGEEWRDAVRIGNVPTVNKMLKTYALVPVLGVLVLSLVEVRSRKPGQRLPVRYGIRSYDRSWWHLCLLALLPLVTTIALLTVLKMQGVEPFLRHQAFWRANYCWLFALVLAAAEAVRVGLPAWPFAWARSAKLWPATVTVLLVALFAYHNYRIFWFVKNTAGREFFLTADAEKLRPWLEEFSRQHPQFQLATASVELNYLAAYWTNADLLMPFGFPYHNAESNAAIRDRAVGLLRLYNTPPKTWLELTAVEPGRFHELWRTSRVKASAKAYLYQWYHRLMNFERYGESRFRDSERIAIAAQLKRKVEPTFLPRPDVILVDSVSRALGKPDLTHYAREFRAGSIEVWVRQDVLLADRAEEPVDSLRR